MTAPGPRWACGCEGPMHTLGGECMGAVIVARWPDGCPKAGHVRDAICALGKVDLPPADEPDPSADPGPWTECKGCQGGEGWMDGEAWTDCPECEGTGGWST